MKKPVLTLFALLLFSFSLQSQVSVTTQFGVSGYSGDLHSQRDERINVFDELGLSVGFGARYAISNTIGVRAEVTLINLTGDDTNFGDQSHFNRAWHFQNRILEIATLVDYEILGNRSYDGQGKFSQNITPIVFGGIGVTFSDPQVNWNDFTSPEIEKDQEKGERVILAFPVGIGMKCYLSEYFAFSTEFGIRLPVSDYYDGLSHSGNPDNNDGYAFIGIKAFFNLSAIEGREVEN